MTATATSMARSPMPTLAKPQLESAVQWLSVREYAVLMNRSVRTIQHWCKDGTLVAFGVRFYRDKHGPHGRFWIAYKPLP